MHDELNCVPAMLSCFPFLNTWSMLVVPLARWNAGSLDVQIFQFKFRFIGRLPDSGKKAEEYSTIDYQQQAAEVAAKLKDGDLFVRIQNAVSANSPAGVAIQQMKDRLQMGFR